MSLDADWDVPGVLMGTQACFILPALQAWLKGLISPMALFWGNWSVPRIGLFVEQSILGGRPYWRLCK